MQELRLQVLRALYALGRLSGCHRRPDRSFYFKGYIFPVCARCTGIAAAAPLGVVFGLLYTAPLWFLLLAVPMGIDWFLTRQNITPGNNWIRFVTGFVYGFGAAALQVRLIIWVIAAVQRFL